MTPERCLEWVQEFWSEAHDFRTSMNVIEWLAPKAATVARTSEDRERVATALGMAHAVTGPYLRTGQNPDELPKGWE